MTKHRHDTDDDLDFEERGRPAKALRCDVLHTDDDFFVIDKPAGMFFEGGLFDDPSVVEQLQTDEDAADGLDSVYPLEPDVSGLMVVARNEAALNSLEKQFDDHRMSLTLLALVRGIVLNESGVMEDLLTSPKSGKVKVISEHGDSAITEWRVRDSFVGFALLECTPRTRLEQQVRAQLTHAALPLAVDAAHGGAEHLKLSSFKPNYRASRRHPERPLIRRASIHAWKVAFDHPRTGESLKFEASTPKDFKATLHQLDRFGRIAK